MKKIMFDDKFMLTQAVLEGRKTQTRRICKEQIWAYSDIVNAENGIFHFEIPKYKVGEVVAVAQSYKTLGYNYNALDISPKDFHISRGILGKSKGWNNKMFVRAEACKHQIRITNVHIERLQRISDEDCIKEGVHEATREFPWYWIDGFNVTFNEPQQAFAHLINKVSRKDVWSKNPYVFVYDFELIK